MKIMQKWKKPNNAVQKIDVLLFDQFSNHCLANAVEPLRAANHSLGRKAYDWNFLTLTGEVAISSSGLPVTPHGSLAKSGGGCALFVMPSYGARKFANPAYLRALRSAATRYEVLAGLDMGSWLLAAAGLLKGHRATIHWDEFDAFAEAFPDLSVARDRFTMDGDRWTCGGAMTAFDLVLCMIGQTHGQAIRLDTEAMFLAQGTGSQSSEPRMIPTSKLVSASVAVMRGSLEHPKTIGEIAHFLGTRQSVLDARFHGELGAPPRTVYRRLRLSQVRRYAEQSRLSIAEIAVRCGYLDPSAMTRACREEFGKTPSQLRREANV